MADDPRFTFNALERRGLFLGLQPGQVATLAAAVVGAVLAARLAGGPAGPVLAVLLLGSGAVATWWPRAGRPVASWTPLVAAWAARCSRGPTLAALRSPYRPGAARPAPPGIDLVEVEGWPGQDALGVVRDRRCGTWAAVVPVDGRSFALLDADGQATRMEAWRALLATLARPGTPLRRIQWVYRSAPIIDRTLSLPEVQLPGLAGADAQESYRQLVCGPASLRQSHRVWMVLVAGGARALEELRRELRLLDGHLRSADLGSPGPIGLDALQDLLAAAYRREVTDLPGGPRRRPWAMATDESWSALRVDGTWHATYWVAEWPRVEVGADFLTPLLLCDGRRTVSVLMAPVSPDRAAREARAARAADLADEQLRARAGFLPSARRGREAEGVLRREAELAYGHAEYRFAGYVTVTGGDRRELEAACVETQRAAERAHLELCRLYGRQEEAFTWTLPLGRGLA